MEEFPHVVILSDEVQDFLEFESSSGHVYIHNVRNNHTKTISVWSGGKIFSATGWHVGWAIGPNHILRGAANILSTILYSPNTPGQVAIAKCLTRMSLPNYIRDISFFDYYKEKVGKSRQYFKDADFQKLRLPFRPLPSEGGYFVLADVSELRSIIPVKYMRSHDYENDKNTKIPKN